MHTIYLVHVSFDGLFKITSSGDMSACHSVMGSWEPLCTVENFSYKIFSSRVWIYALINFIIYIKLSVLWLM